MSKIKEIEDKILTTKKAIDSPSFPETFKAKMRDKLSALEKELAEAKAEKPAEEKKPAAQKKEPAKKKPSGKAHAKKPTTEKTVVIGGKQYVKDSPEHCAALADMWEKRRSQAKKNAKKATKTGVFENITDKVGATVEKAIRASIKENKKEIKKDPDKHIKQFVELKKAGRLFLIQFRSVLGSKYKSSELDDFEKRMNEMINSLKKSAKDKG